MRALYRSLQVPVAPVDTDHASIVSFAHTHGRLAIVPALKASANRRLETLRIEVELRKQCAPSRGAKNQQIRRGRHYRACDLPMRNAVACKTHGRSLSTDPSRTFVDR